MRKLYILLFLFAAFVANAQKKDDPKSGLRVPSTIKIDGKADEWGGKKALMHNGVTNMYYAFANDDANLYMVIMATHPRVIQKILSVGVSLTVNTNAKKNDKDVNNIYINYPQVEGNHNVISGILIRAGDKANWSPLVHQTEYLNRTDSSVMLANNNYYDHAKTIKIKGIKAISDTLISVYNDVNIAAVGKFANDGSYTYELRIPLKYLGLSVDGRSKFIYNLKLEDWNNPDLEDYSVWDPVLQRNTGTYDANPDLNSTTQFWGEYILAKAP